MTPTTVQLGYIQERFTVTVRRHPGYMRQRTKQRQRAKEGFPDAKSVHMGKVLVQKINFSPIACGLRTFPFRSH